MTVEELVCAIVLMFFAVQGSIPFIAPNQALEATGSSATGLMFWGGVGSQVIVYATVTCLMLRRAGRLVSWMPAMQWTLPLAAWVVASTLWSQFPLYTVRRSIPFALAGVFGLYFAMRFSLSRQLAILRVTMVTLALASVVMALAFPRLGLDASPGHHANWQGVFTQKNTCGRMMVLATTVLLAEWRPAWSRIAGAGLFLLVLVMSGSRSAWLVEGAIVVLWGALLVITRLEARTRILFLLGALSIIPVAACLGYKALSALALNLGRDPTFSGRTLIWKQVSLFILQRPLLGWGYEAFWRGTHGEAFHVIAAVRFMVFHAHNGFLEIWLELGLVGLLLFLLSYFRAWKNLWPYLRAGRIDRIGWMVFLLALVLLYDLDENTLLTYNGIFWTLYVAALANIEFLTAEDAIYSRGRSHAKGNVYAESSVLS